MSVPVTSSTCERFGHLASRVDRRCVCVLCDQPLTIVVGNGEVFFGSLAQFEACVFATRCIGAIAEWCEEQGHSLEFQRERPAS